MLLDKEDLPVLTDRIVAGARRTGRIIEAEPAAESPADQRPEPASAASLALADAEDLLASLESLVQDADAGGAAAVTAPIAPDILAPYPGANGSPAANAAAPPPASQVHGANGSVNGSVNGSEVPEVPGLYPGTLEPAAGGVLVSPGLSPDAVDALVARLQATVDERLDAAAAAIAAFVALRGELHAQIAAAVRGALAPPEPPARD